MDYYKLLQLEREPFSNSPDPEFFFQSRQHRGCLQKLELALRLKRGLNIVMGDIGSGKTTLCREIIRKFAAEPEFETHLILDPAFTSTTTRYAPERLGVSPGTVTSASSTPLSKAATAPTLADTVVVVVTETAEVVDDGPVVAVASPGVAGPLVDVVAIGPAVLVVPVDADDPSIRTSLPASGSSGETWPIWDNSAGPLMRTTSLFPTRDSAACPLTVTVNASPTRVSGQSTPTVRGAAAALATAGGLAMRTAAATKAAGRAARITATTRENRHREPAGLMAFQCSTRIPGPPGLSRNGRPLDGGLRPWLQTLDQAEHTTRFFTVDLLHGIDQSPDDA